MLREFTDDGRLRFSGGDTGWVIAIGVLSTTELGSSGLLQLRCLAALGPRFYSTRSPGGKGVCDGAPGGGAEIDVTSMDSAAKQFGGTRGYRVFA
jgi:hypothetical protein